MQIVTEPEISQALKYPELIYRLRIAFAGQSESPPRHHHTVQAPQGPPITLLLMPSWRAGCSIGVKIVAVVPSNAEKGIATIQGVYALFDGVTGQPRVLLDAAALTARRTAATSALASDLLSRTDSASMLMVGAGALAQPLIEAHCSVRPIQSILLWNRHVERARDLRRRLKALLPDKEIAVATDLPRAASQADIISCATPSHLPLIHGEWLTPGCHLDLVGGFTPAMREVDDVTVSRARIFVDTREGALSEAGDLLSPLQRGVIELDRIEADLRQLCLSGPAPGRDPRDITLFKSVGVGLEDLVAAELVVGALSG